MKQFERLTSYTVKSPLKYSEQYHVISETNHCPWPLWCEDYLHIEVLKYIIANDWYFKEPPIPRLNRNNFSKEKLAEIVEEKLKEIDNIESNHDNLFVNNAGRGELVLYASFVKPWNKIMVFEQNKLYAEFLKTVMNDHLGIKIELGIPEQIMNYAVVEGLRRDTWPREK